MIFYGADKTKIVNEALGALQYGATPHGGLAFRLTEGFRPAFERFGFWLYIKDKDVLHLITPKEGDGRTSQKSSFDHVAFKTANYQDVLKKLQSLSIPFEEKPIPGMTVHQIFLKDPAGNRVELNFEN